MDQQQAQQIEQVLRPNWRQIRYRILDQFAQVSTSDLDAAVNVNDLVQRIADKSHHSERYVETRLQELVGVGAAAGQQAGLQVGQPFGMQAGQQQLGQQAGQQPLGQQPLGQQGAQQTAGQPAGQPFGASAQ